MTVVRALSQPALTTLPTAVNNQRRAIRGAMTQTRMKIDYGYSKSLKIGRLALL
jgi:hypothetical protein